MVGDSASHSRRPIGALAGPFTVVFLTLLLVGAGGCVGLGDGPVADTPSAGAPTASTPASEARGTLDTSGNLVDAGEYRVADDTLVVNATVPGDEFVEYNTAYAGADAFLALLRARVDGDRSGVVVGVRTGQDARLTVTRRLLHDREGTRIDEPSVSLATLRAALPSRATVTIRHGDSAYSGDYPIVVENRSIQQD